MHITEIYQGRHARSRRYGVLFFESGKRKENQACRGKEREKNSAAADLRNVCLCPPSCFQRSLSLDTATEQILDVSRPDRGTSRHALFPGCGKAERGAAFFFFFLSFFSFPFLAAAAAAVAAAIAIAPAALEKKEKNVVGGPRHHSPSASGTRNYGSGSIPATAFRSFRLWRSNCY